MEKLKVPNPRLMAEFSAATADGEARRIDMTWYTGANVERYSWSDGRYMLTLSMNPEHVRMGRLASGKAPLLDTHSDWSLKDVIGVIEKASVDGGRGSATVRFSNREDVSPVWQDVKDGILRNASVGARIYKLKDTSKEDDTVKSYLAVDWEPLEVSLVPIGADANAGFAIDSKPENFTVADVEPLEVELSAASATEETQERASSPIEEHAMDQTIENAGENARTELNAAPVVDVEAVKKAERERVNAILATGKKFNLDALATEHAAKDTTAEQFGAIVLTELAKRQEAQPTTTTAHAEVTRDSRETLRAGMEIALLHRHDASKYKIDEMARPYVGMSLLECAKECLVAQGISPRGKSKMEVARLALQSTSDFPNVLAAGANKTLRAGYDMEPSRWREIASRRSAPDFKSQNEVYLDAATSLSQVNEAGEFKRGKLVEGKESWKVVTYGEIIGITRQVIVNDDLNAFTRIPQLMGRQAAMLEADTVWAILTSNPTMSDSNALFIAAHSNLIDAGTAIDITNLGIIRKTLRVQTGPGGEALGLTPRFMVVNAAKESLALQYLSTTVAPAVQTNVNPWQGSMTLISEPRLDAASATAWYVFADPNLEPVIVYAYLEGAEGVYTETRQGFDIDGTELKVRLDFGAGAVGWRGAVKNLGA